MEKMGNKAQITINLGLVLEVMEEMEEDLPLAQA